MFDNDVEQKGLDERQRRKQNYPMPYEDVVHLLSTLDHTAFGYSKEAVQTRDILRRMETWRKGQDNG